MKLTQIIYLYTILFCSCNVFNSTPLDDIYALAGANAKELKKVIAHFSKDERLSLQLEAARHILGNMPGHTSMDDANYLDYSKRLKSMPMPIGTEDLNSLWSVSSIRYSDDVGNMESAFLIQDIEDAFRIRDSVPWGKTIPFDTFKEHVLPYKVHKEVLVLKWRITLYNRYKHVVEGETDPKEAFVKLLTYLKKHTREANSNFSGDIDPLTMDHLKRGSCSQLCVYYVAVLRALGLPASYDYIDGWGNYSRSGHSWVSYIGDEGTTYTVANRDSVLRTMNPIDASTFKEHYDPQHENFSVSKKKTVYKIYRNTYELNGHTHHTKTEHGGVHFKDVSRYYGLTGSVSFHAPGYDYVSLSVFKTGEDWREFEASKVERGKANFDNLGDSVIYLPTFYKNEVEQEVGRPFFINGETETIWISSDEHRMDELILRRKYPLFGNWPAMWHKMEGAKIEVSATKDFRNPTTIHAINETPMGLLCFEIDPAIDVKYIRYVCPPGSRTPIAEFRVFDERNEQVPIVETMGYKIEDEMVSLAFDNNVLTSASTKEEAYWIGAKLEEANPKRISRVEIIPKNDGNFIDAGDRYHLYYFDGEWILLGEQVASSNLLTYNNAPSGTLFLLKNLSKGREERVFTMEEGRQVWW